jgi:hypothetical protein
MADIKYEIEVNIPGLSGAGDGGFSDDKKKASRGGGILGGSLSKNTFQDLISGNTDAQTKVLLGATEAIAFKVLDYYTSTIELRTGDRFLQQNVNLAMNVGKNIVLGFAVGGLYGGLATTIGTGVGALTTELNRGIRTKWDAKNAQNLQQLAGININNGNRGIGLY